jgi:hypothetical protein
LIEPTQLVFAVVIAASLEFYREVVVNPVADGNYIAALALVSVYLTTVWSWLGWHNAFAKYPYRVRKDSGAFQTSEVLRFYTDLGIVIVYAYMLFRVNDLVDRPAADMLALLIGFPLIFVTYFIETSLRAIEYGPTANRVPPLTLAFAAFTALVILYAFLRDQLSAIGNDRIWLNGITIVATIVLMKLYRWGNGVYGRRRAVAQPQGAPVG